MFINLNAALLLERALVTRYRSNQAVSIHPAFGFVLLLGA